MYIKDRSLCFSDYNEEISIPGTCIKSIKEIRKKASLAGWNKEESIRSPKYKIINNSIGMLDINSYFQIIVRNDSEEYEILIPNYDMEKLKPLLSEVSGNSEDY